MHGPLKVKFMSSLGILTERKLGAFASIAVGVETWLIADRGKTFCPALVTSPFCATNFKVCI